MKTIFKDGVYDRVDNEVGELRVKAQGWKYVAKEEWKKNSRGYKTEPQAVESEKKEVTLSKKAARRLAIKSKQRES